MKVFSTSLCFGLLALLSVMNLLKSAHGRQPLTAASHVPVSKRKSFVRAEPQSGHELFPANKHTIQEKLLLSLLSHNPGFQRPSHAGVDPSIPDDLKQLKKLKEQFMEGKSSELTHAADAVDSNLSSSRPNKRACFWKYCV